MAPSERKSPNSLLTDESCEPFAFPYLFLTDKFYYSAQPDMKLNPVRYFNQRLLNYTQLFASEADIFFMLCQLLNQ